MNTKEAVKIFKELGWVPKLDVDRYAEKEFDDRVVNIGFKVRSLAVCQKFEADHSLKTRVFTNAVKEIEGNRKEFNDLLKVDFKNQTCFQENEITREHIEMACDRAVKWAMPIDIDARYEELCDLDPSTPGAAGIWHLAALTIKQRTDKLANYQRCFASGDHCGFVPFITKDHIDRAFALADSEYVSRHVGPGL